MWQIRPRKRFMSIMEFGGTDQESVCYFFPLKTTNARITLKLALYALHQLFGYQPSLLRHALPAQDKKHGQDIARK